MFLTLENIKYTEREQDSYIYLEQEFNTYPLNLFSWIEGT